MFTLRLGYYNYYTSLGRPCLVGGSSVPCHSRVVMLSQRSYALHNNAYAWSHPIYLCSILLQFYETNISMGVFVCVSQLIRKKETVCNDHILLIMYLWVRSLQVVSAQTRLTIDLIACLDTMRNDDCTVRDKLLAKSSR